MGKAMPRFMYGDPMRAAMRSEARSCKGCASLERVFGRELCAKGNKTRRCGQFVQTKKGEANVL